MTYSILTKNVSRTGIILRTISCTTRHSILIDKMFHLCDRFILFSHSHCSTEGWRLAVIPHFVTAGHIFQDWSYFILVSCTVCIHFVGVAYQLCKFGSCLLRTVMLAPFDIWFRQALFHICSNFISNHICRSCSCFALTWTSNFCW